mmetsp:Transcript_2271/g.4133  ORF Transcript_2271/g.4133 Transcript_2271/m.4133 type:complete len:767 (-) Transcript_2271:101-2401(-)|eukprot:CAMPEP_0197658232 /NCGR_PEP_ID=MMETSP1338-20131121/45113_1 /TAXON_ID=43686 ORGANISM="Pelagodinium beii, Strain RCC1491" /NCGR_SAMPLE_ID=MMETSP1338 /ASSEMBLY_ACC=CAM_ASM_000754 /LENGTH=766 /DNA_ID=CAMNT_0043234783 /DNA_START=112 /DNA_END=2412 /DNA_ORIENTATION=-
MIPRGVSCVLVALLAEHHAVALEGACQSSGLLDGLEDGPGNYLLQTSAAKAASPAPNSAKPEPDDDKTNSTKKKNKNTADSIVGVNDNAEGDLAAFEAGFLTNVGTGIGFIIAFLILKRMYPVIYENNALVEESLKEGRNKLGTSVFSPLYAGCTITIDDVAELAGLDQAMLLQFCQLSMKMFLFIGVPAVVLLAPLYAFASGQASGNKLSKVGFSNVEADSWLCWLVALFVWYVVVIVQNLIFRTQEQQFMPRRKKWLMKMPMPQSNTVLLESIPEEYRNPNKIASFFGDIFGSGSVSQVSFVRDTSNLQALVKKRDDINSDLHEAQFLSEKSGAKDESKESALKQSLQTAEADVDKAREDILAQVSEGISASAFVTFNDQAKSIMALSLCYTEDDEEFVVSVPPDPSDVRYDDLQVGFERMAASETVGYGLIAGLFFGFLPIVTAITNVLSLSTLMNVPVFNDFFTANPTIAELWSSLAATLGLNMFMSYLPTFLVLIFGNFFVLKADNGMQHLLQQWYFYFLLIFVVLVTAVGTSLWERSQDLVEHPTAVFSLLADNLPTASHFYLNYLPLQFSQHCMNLLRYMPLFKYLGFRKVCSEERARQAAEPEDQDFYGMGSRSARHTLVVVIGLIFCTITPAMAPLAFLNAFACRVVYGYLVVYAETRKPDLGGEFWCTQLRHIQQGLGIYIVLMVGVLLQRSTSSGPAVIAGSSSVAWLIRYRRFDHKFHIDSLRIRDIPDAKMGENRVASRTTYDQPELVAPKKS